eukprot:scaffold151961_cov23-Cyclotella_meneghiniana.AAC.1
MCLPPSNRYRQTSPLDSLEFLEWRVALLPCPLSATSELVASCCVTSGVANTEVIAGAICVTV